MYICGPNIHCVKSVRIQSFSAPHFTTFGLNTGIYFVNLRIQSDCGKMRARKTPNMDIFYAVIFIRVREKVIFFKCIMGNYVTENIRECRCCCRVSRRRFPIKRYFISFLLTKGFHLAKLHNT